MSEEYLSDADVGIGAPKETYLSDADVGLSDKSSGSGSSSEGLLSRTEDDGYLTGTLKGAATAIIKGAANIPGVYGNTRDFGRYLADRALTGLGGMDQAQIDSNRKKYDSGIGHDWVPSGSSISKPVLDKTGDYVPESGLGRAAQAGLETVISAAGPGSGVASKGAGAREALTGMFKPGIASTNALAGSVGEAATEFTGDPLYGFGASILSGPAAHAGGFALKKGAGPMLAQFHEPTRQKLAAEQFQSYADDPAALRENMWPAKGPVQDEIVPDSKLTTGQLYGDVGLLESERQFRADDDFKHRLNEREADQNEARITALKNIPSDNANSSDLVRSIEQRHEGITQKYAQAEERLRADAEKAATNLGERADPMEIGEKLRSEIQKIREEEAAEIGKLYDAVDPNGDMRLLTTPLKEGIKEIEARRTESTKWSPGLESVLEVATSVPEVWSLKELRGLDKRLSDEMSAERRSAGETESWSGLKILKGKVKDAINNAVEHQAAWEKAAGINPEDGLEGRIGSLDSGTTVPSETGSGVGEGVSQAAANGSGQVVAGPENGAGRTPNGGSGNVDRGPGLAQKAGSENKIFYPGGNISGRYEVVDLGDLITSHDLDFNENPKFPQELQPRDRSAKPAQDQVNNLSSKLNPEQLGPSAEANTGAPIVGPDGVVESGNGRTLAISKNYAAGDPRGYRKWLESQGYSTEGMKNPVLVARRTSEMSPAQREFFTQNANSSTGLRMRAGEQGAADAKFLTPDVMVKLREGSLTSEENADFINSLMNKLPVNERAGFADADGRISQSGLERLRAAIMHSAYGDADIVKRAFESTDNNIKNITGALTDASGSWSKMRVAAREGDIGAEHDVTHLLLNTVKKVMKARDEGRPLSEILSQKDLLEGDTPALVESLLIKDGKVVSRKQLAKNLENYAQESLKNQGGGLFESDVSPDDILRTVSGKEQLPPETEAAPKVEPPKEPEQGTFSSGAGEDTRPKPNMTQESADNLAKANQRYGEYAQTYRKGDVGSTLRTTGFKDQYQIKDSSVAAKAVRPGDTGYETATNFFKASKNSPGSVEAMKEMLLNHFRNAVGADGLMQAKNYTKLVQKYEGVIRAIEERSPGFMKDVSKAKNASEMLDAFTIRRKEAMDTLNKEAAAKFLGLTDSRDIENAVGRMIDGSGATVGNIRSLVKTLSPEALDGMRRAAVDWMLRAKTNAARPGVGDSPALSFAKIDKLLKNNAPILSELFTKDQMNVLQSIRRDMMMSDRSVTATRDRTNPSGTARSVKQHIGDAIGTVTGQSMFAVALGTLYHAWETGGLSSLVTAGVPMLGVRIGGDVRASGVAAINDLVKGALLDPVLARQLMQKAPEPPKSIHRTGESKKLWATKEAWRLFLNSVYRSYVPNTSFQDADKRDTFKAGGRIARKPMTAEQLIAGLEKMRREQQSSTQVLINQPDEAIVRALNIANQHI